MGPGGASLRVVLLVNPAADRGRARDSGPLVADRLRARGLEVEVVTGVDAADGERRLRAALLLPAAAIVACGGDGTVNQALQHAAGSDLPLGIIPAGTGNDAAAAFGLPRDPVAGAQVVVDGLADPDHGVRTVDVGEVSTADGQNRRFLAVLSSGFDSLVNERANTMTWPGGKARYLRAILAELRVFRPVEYDVLLDAGLPTETGYTRRGMLVAVGNGRSYGGGMLVCPDAVLDDGLLSITFLGELRTRTFLRVFPSVFRGTHVRRPEVSTHTARTVRLDAPGQVAYADGERVGPLPVHVQILPGALRVLVPGPSQQRQTT